MEDKLKKIIIETIKKAFGIELEVIKLEVPPRKDLGDYAFGCFVLSKDLQKKPVQIATELASSFDRIDSIESVTAAGPYLNIKLSNSIYTNLFNTLYSNKETIVGTQKLNNETIIIDYIGANVGKPLHIGHMCTPNQGQVLINIYKKLGYNVISDSHIGDWGIVFGKLILAYKLWGDEIKLKENAVEHLFQLYVKITVESEEKGEEIEQKTRDEFKLLSKGNTESIELWSKFTKYSIEAMNIQLKRLNIKPDFNIGESFYEGLGLPKMENYPNLSYDMHTIVKELIDLGIATKNEDNSVGVVFDDELKIPSCILQKRDGTHGYLASDLASIKYRMENWNPKKIVYFVDARQQMHLKQAFTIAKKATWVNDTELFHAYNGFISLKDGAMSTRKGKIIKLDLLLDEAELRAKNIILEKRDDISGDELNNLSRMIGIGAIKYGYLKKSREIDIIFDWDEFMTFDGNSGPYIQYAYVRAIRILEKSSYLIFPKGNDEATKGNFEFGEEIELIKAISNYSDVLIKTTETNSPHLLCKYAYELTKTFNAFYNNIHILSEDDENKKMMRLKLVELFSEVLKDSFKMLGIEMPDKM
ncbi:MAG: arginine--tRNA ligase [Candidatus Gracilibacteria bacterium]